MWLTMISVIYRNKLIAICMLAILVLSQFALATHTAVHYDHSFYVNVAQTDDIVIRVKNKT